MSSQFRARDSNLSSFEIRSNDEFGLAPRRLPIVLGHIRRPTVEMHLQHCIATLDHGAVHHNREVVEGWRARRVEVGIVAGVDVEEWVEVFGELVELL